MKVTHFESSGIIPCPLPTGKQFRNLAGLVFGNISVESFAGKKMYGKTLAYFYKCTCQCGTVTFVAGTNLRSGGTKSCGCLVGDAARKRPNSHGLKNTPEHTSWRSMMVRCTDPKNHNWKHYGGRGIKVCPEWIDFRQFLKDVGRKPSPDYTLDRYPNNDGNYEPGNVRWASAVQQHRNTRTNRMITIDGVTRCVAEWTELMGLPREIIYVRLAKGWNETKAVQTPVLRVRRTMTIDGVTRLVSDWAKLMNIRRALIVERLSDGWTERDAVTTPVKKMKTNATKPSTS